MDAKLQEIFPDRDATKVISLFQPLMNGHILSENDRRNGVGKPVFRLAPLGHEQLFSVIAPNLCEPYISDAVPQQIVNEACTTAQDRMVLV